jgi:imidazoleglycerol-phosphate dehydratase
MRRGNVARRTTETDVRVAVTLDGAGRARVATGVGFFDHMLTLLARHGRLDLEVEANGDLAVDDHHTVEDVGIALGRAVREALGDLRGVTRYADATVPMDEALVRAALDLSGRPMLVFDVPFASPKIGAFDTELVREFFQAFATHAAATLHVDLVRGANAHHVAEACFKALARTLRAAVAIDPAAGDEAPSTKGRIGD